MRPEVRKVRLAVAIVGGGHGDDVVHVVARRIMGYQVVVLPVVPGRRHEHHVRRRRAAYRVEERLGELETAP